MLLNNPHINTSSSSMGICCSVEQHRHHLKPSDRKGRGKAENMSGKGSMSMTPKDVKELCQGSTYVNVDSFSYEEMRMATKRFRPDLIVGEQGLGIVYRGALDDTVRVGSKGVCEVAIKELVMQSCVDLHA